MLLFVCIYTSYILQIKTYIETINGLKCDKIDLLKDVDVGASFKKFLVECMCCNIFKNATSPFLDCSLFPTTDLTENTQKYYEIYSILLSLCMVAIAVKTHVQELPWSFFM
jgi:hypothetical protein